MSTALGVDSMAGSVVRYEAGLAGARTFAFAGLPRDLGRRRPPRDLPPPVRAHAAGTPL